MVKENQSLIMPNKIEDPPLEVHYVYEFLEDLFVGKKPGAMYKKNPVKAGAVMDALMSVYKIGKEHAKIEFSKQIRQVTEDPEELLP